MNNTGSSILLTRKTVCLDRACNNDDADAGGNFSLVSYNILADCHIPKRPRNPERKLYSFCADEDLYKNADKDSNRHVLLMKEIKFLASDVFCIQEVDNSYFPVLQAELDNLGHVSYFEQKVLGTSEGLVTSFRKDKFELLSKHNVVINDLLGSKAESPANSRHEADLASLARNTVALVLHLKDLQNHGRELLVCNFHAYYDLRNPDITTLQACLLADKLLELRNSIEAKRASSPHPSIPVILCGDFNSEPHQYLYKIFVNGSLTKSEAEHMTKIWYELDPETQETKEKERQKGNKSHVIPFLDALVNPLPLKSAYREVMGKEPEATSGEGLHVGTFDYIFYTPELYAISVLDPFTKEQILPGGPSKIFPSDHTSMKATFRYT